MLTRANVGELGVSLAIAMVVLLSDPGSCPLLMLPFASLSRREILPVNAQIELTSRIHGDKRGALPAIRSNA